MVGSVHSILHPPIGSFRTSNSIQGLCPRRSDIPHHPAIFIIWIMEHLARHKRHRVPALGNMRHGFHWHQSQVRPLVRNENREIVNGFISTSDYYSDFATPVSLSFRLSIFRSIPWNCRPFENVHVSFMPTTSDVLRFLET